MCTTTATITAMGACCTISIVATISLAITAPAAVYWLSSGRALLEIFFCLRRKFFNYSWFIFLFAAKQQLLPQWHSNFLIALTCLIFLRSLRLLNKFLLEELQAFK
jgi:hypothetical protein